MTTTSTTTLETPDGPMDVLEAVPDGEVSSAVVVLHEAFGVTSYIEDVCRRFADEGYRTVAPHLFHRAGGGTAAYGDLASAVSLFAGLTDYGVLSDVDAVVSHFGRMGIPANRVGAVGFCFGGRATFLIAARRTIGAAVGLYGGGIVERSKFLPFPALLDEAGAIATPWLGMYGDLDQGIPVDEVEVLRATLARECRTAHDIVRYADAGHAFHNDVVPAYHAESAADAWVRTVEWLRRHGVR